MLVKISTLENFEVSIHDFSSSAKSQFQPPNMPLQIFKKTIDEVSDAQTSFEKEAFDESPNKSPPTNKAMCLDLKNPTLSSLWENICMSDPSRGP